ncbi:macro domain-containing protein [bacterium]|nr:macro domain-containing protein [bacterium]
MLDSLRVNNSTLRLTKGDITELEVAAFVYYAQHDLQLGSGFGTAVSLRGGPKVQEELDGLGPLATTEVVVSGAGRLGAEYILHAVGPRFQEADLESKLRTTVLNCLTQADAKGVASLAFPAMGAGFYGVPLPVCAEISLRAIHDYLCQQTGLENVTVCLLDNREYKVFAEQLKALASTPVKA